jgi:hypothetical protein
VTIHLYGRERTYSRRGRLLFTVEEKIACLEREIRLRKKVYPNRVLTRRMSQKMAHREIELMQQILDDLLTRQEEEKTDLFGIKT